MNKSVLIVYLIWSVNILSIIASFKHMNNSSIAYQETIQLIEDEQQLGYMSFIKIPLLHTFIIHSFYIYPEYRSHGYGTRLLQYVCDYLVIKKAHRIYVQIGPFELPHVSSGNGLNMEQLIKLYAKCGFELCNKSTCALAGLSYSFININENSRYLMVKVI